MDFTIPESRRDEATRMLERWIDTFRYENVSRLAIVLFAQNLFPLSTFDGGRIDISGDCKTLLKCGLAMVELAEPSTGVRSQEFYYHRDTFKRVAQPFMLAGLKAYDAGKAPSADLGFCTFGLFTEYFNRSPEPCIDNPKTGSEVLFHRMLTASGDCLEPAISAWVEASHLVQGTRRLTPAAEWQALPITAELGA